MNNNSWCLRLKQKRKMKQDQKLKEKYGFLLNAINEYNQDTTIKLIHIEKLIENATSEIYNRISDLENRLHAFEDNMLSYNQAIQSNQSSTVDSIKIHADAIRDEFASQVQQLKKPDLLDLKLSQVNEYEKAHNEQISELLSAQGSSLSADIEETKKLIELLAVNELLDNICTDNTVKNK